MSVTNKSNQNQLQQVEMRLCHVHFHHTSNTTWSTVHADCIILWTFEAISLALLVKTLTYTTGTTSKHQRAMWPELYPKSILFLHIVAWHMSVPSLVHCLRLWCRMLRRYQKRSKKHISTLISSHRKAALSDLHEKNAFFAFPSRNAILITEIRDFC